MKNRVKIFFLVSEEIYKYLNGGGERNGKKQTLNH